MYVDNKSTVPAAWNDPARNAMDQMLENMKNTKSGAKGAQFSVSQESGEELLRTIHAMQDWLAGAGGDHRQLEQKPLLGTSHGARVMAPFLQQVAGDNQGFLTQLRQLRDVLANAEETIKKAIAAYHRQDSAAASSFRG